MFSLIYTVAYLAYQPPVLSDFRHPQTFATMELCERFANVRERNFNRVYEDEKQIIKWECVDG